jgi:hypothetical protein
MAGKSAHIWVIEYDWSGRGKWTPLSSVSRGLSLLKKDANIELLNQQLCWEGRRRAPKGMRVAKYVRQEGK